MKYVKSISLFFVYPACCFLLGLFMGNVFKAEYGTEIAFSEPQLRQEMTGNIDAEYRDDNTAEHEVNVKTNRKESLPGQYVMNHNAIQEMIENDRTMENGYYMTLLEGYVVVYHGDRQTIFLATDIKAEELPADVQADLNAWMYMDDEGMLYDFLENYTSYFDIMQELIHFYQK